ncbi:MAG TPA: extracellular solute-binding protein [Pirellulales bacterium]|nr:extracellular solute-binding protein [Pirellulales bacterium]
MKSARTKGGLAQLFLFAFSLPLLFGCWSKSNSEVVVYTAQDQKFAEPLFKEFTKQTSIAVRPKFDAESTKTVGLVTELEQEAARPRADVFWNNEILTTLRLEKRGLLESFSPAAAKDYPAEYRDPGGMWYGFAARARILLVNKQLVPEDKRPRSIEDLANEKWRGRVALAKPLFGTTATHAACLFAAWGDEKAEQFFLRLKANQIQVLGGNKQVAVNVGNGKLAFGLTDTDDALEEIRNGQPVVIVYPDQQVDGIGTLFIPNTLAIMKGCPHPEAARRLVEWLLSPETETKLAEGPSGQIPLNRQVKAKPPVETPATIRPMNVEFAAAADKWDVAAKFLRDQFTGAE